MCRIKNGARDGEASQRLTCNLELMQAQEEAVVGGAHEVPLALWGGVTQAHTIDASSAA